MVVSQSGFWSSYSCSTAFSSITEYILRGFDYLFSTGVVLLVYSRTTGITMCPMNMFSNLIDWSCADASQLYYSFGTYIETANKKLNPDLDALFSSAKDHCLRTNPFSVIVFSPVVNINLMCNKQSYICRIICDALVLSNWFGIPVRCYWLRSRSNNYLSLIYGSCRHTDLSSFLKILY